MKLTLKQLRNLEMGDWVWVIGEDYPETPKGYYAQILCQTSSYTEIDSLDWGVQVIHHSDYNVKWVAYKNREEAETPEFIREGKQILKRRSADYIPYTFCSTEEKAVEALNSLLQKQEEIK